MLCILTIVFWLNDFPSYATVRYLPQQRETIFSGICWKSLISKEWRVNLFQVFLQTYGINSAEACWHIYMPLDLVIISSWNGVMDWCRIHCPEQAREKFQSTTNLYIKKKYFSKCLQNGIHFVQASLCQIPQSDAQNRFVSFPIMFLSCWAVGPTHFWYLTAGRS